MCFDTNAQQLDTKLGNGVQGNHRPTTLAVNSIKKADSLELEIGLVPPVGLEPTTR